MHGQDLDLDPCKEKVAVCSGLHGLVDDLPARAHWPGHP